MRLRELILLPALALAQTPGEAPDNPLVSRFAGSRVFESWKSDYAAYPFARSSIAAAPAPAASLSTVEGRLSKFIYLAPAGKSPLEISRNFEAALTHGGFKIAFSCAETACGPELFNQLRLATQNFAKPEFLPYVLGGIESSDRHYLHAERETGNQKVNVALYTGMFSSNWRPELKAAPGEAIADLTIVEQSTMATGQVAVDSAALRNALRTAGRIALYRIQFQTDSAALTGDSAAQIGEILKLLNSDRALRLYVVGHTDNQGTVEHNLDLSARRAASVIEALVKGGAAANRLRSFGAGPFSPIAANTAEPGRAQNRRVELVLP